MIALLYLGEAALKHIRHQTMVRYAAASFRESDGAPNLLIMEGDSGYIGASEVYLRYQPDGFLDIGGTNSYEVSFWKQIGELELSPGCYSLDGFSNTQKELELQVTLIDVADNKSYITQNGEIKQFEVIGFVMAKVYIRVLPFAKVSAKARPAVYKDE